ncbi:hypothetical protein N9N67_07660, partial [Bacteriovoracaceae bacterium]|nr:hypothetical protein [Bacteriovoracaceae bacterium]
MKLLLCILYVFNFCYSQTNSWPEAATDGLPTNLSLRLMPGFKEAKGRFIDANILFINSEESRFGFNTKLRSEYFDLGPNYLNTSHDMKVSFLADLSRPGDEFFGIGLFGSLKISDLDEKDYFPSSLDPNVAITKNYGVQVKFVDQNGNYFDFDINPFAKLNSGGSEYLDLRAQVCFLDQYFVETECQISSVVINDDEQSLVVATERYNISLTRGMIDNLFRVGLY